MHATDQLISFAVAQPFDRIGVYFELDDREVLAHCFASGAGARK
jgi:hypothetical protein